MAAGKKVGGGLRKNVWFISRKKTGWIPEMILEAMTWAWNSKQLVFLWLFQLDDSKSLHKKWLFHQTSIKKWLFRVLGETV